MWILLSIFCVRLYSSNLHRHLKRIILHPTKLTNPYHIVHYTELYKAYSACSASGISTSTVNEKYLCYIATIKRSSVTDIFCSDLNQAWSAKTQAEIDRYFYNFYLELLNKSIQKYPKMKFLKATLARVYAKKEEFCALADNNLDKDLSSWYSFSNSYYLIKLTIANKLQNGRRKQSDPLEGRVKGNLDLQSFIQISSEFRKIQKEIIEQIKLQNQFWQDFQSSKPDFMDLVRCAQKIHSKSRIINLDMALHHNIARVNSFESLLVSGMYYSFVQNETSKAQKILGEYLNIKSRKIQIYTGSNNSDNLTTNSFYLVISASSKKLGIIIDCSGRAKKVFGIPRELLIGKSLTTLMPSIYAKSYESVFNFSYNGSKPEALERPREVAFFSNNGYLMQAKMQISLNYLPEYGLCFYALLKPIQDHKRLVLVNTYGDILNFSKEFGEDMGIIQGEQKARWDINKFCPEIGKIFQDFINTSSPILTSPEILTATKIDNKDEQNIKFMDGSETFIKEVNLIFYPLLGKKEFEKRVFSTQETREEINYRADLRELVVEGTQVFELKLEKVNTNDNDNIPKRLKKNFSNKLTLKITKQENEHPNISLESYKWEANHLSSPESVQQLMSPGALFQRITLMNTIQTNEDVNLIEKEQAYSPTVFRRKRKIDLDTYTESAKLEETPVFTFPVQARFSNGDVHIAEVEEDEDLNGKGLSEILQSDMGDIKVNNEPHALQQQNFDLAKLDVNLGKKNFRERASSTHDPSFTGEKNRYVRAHKLIRKMVNSKNHSLFTIYYNLSFIVTMLILMSFLVWLNYQTSDTSITVGNLGNVVHAAYFRNYWTKIACQDTVWVLALGDDESSAAGNTSFNSMIQANENLETAISGLDLEYQNIFYERNVRIYELNDTNQNQLISTDDSFQAIKKIYNIGLPFILKSVYVALADFIKDKTTRFVLDNSMNDLLIVTENQMQMLKDRLFGTLASSKKAMIVFMGITMATLCVFVLLSLLYIIRLNNESNKCLDIMFTLPDQQITNTEKCLDKFKELLELDSEEAELQGLVNDSKSYSVKRDTEESAKNTRKVTRKASMKKVYTRNYFIFASLFACLSVVVAFALIYHNQALSKLAVIEKQQINSNAALDYLNAIALITISVQQILLENSTTTVRNGQILPEFLEAVQMIKEVTHLQNNLKNDQGEYSPRQEEILFNFNCSEADSLYSSWGPGVLVPECQSLSDGLNVVGLVQVLGKLDMAWLSKYEIMNKDIHTLYESFYYDYVAFGGIATMTDISIVILAHSYMASTSDFTSSVKASEDGRIVLTWVACIVTLVLGTIMYILVVRRLSKIEFENKDLLSLVPNKLVFENFLLRKYIIKISRGGSEEAQKLLKMK